ncbi:calcineurin-like phosphoesterase C-terminal domain-containing protein [Sunxiuqinia rutila]|uniref:calcineurin-like phosphoesterase C-terminal domain-containing protein n=1 Tax=Sunxiuqinia rutila TaxID=1397841 RepID=UPI003D361DE5
MIKKLGLILILLVWGWSVPLSSMAQKQVIYKGRVSCEGKGIEGVAVTDGFSVVKTGKNGKYKLPADLESSFVYISSPSGYTVPVVNSVPHFFQPVSSGEKIKAIDFQLQRMDVDDSQHGFVVWADPQLKTSEEALLAREVASDLKKLVDDYAPRPFHGLGAGDIVGDVPALYDSIKSLLSLSGIPFYQSMGNHDMYFTKRSNKKAEQTFEKYFGPAYYSFNRGEIHYVVLNNVFYLGRDYFYIGYLTEEQLAWLEQDLAHVDAGSTVVVNLHIPTTLNEQDLKQFSYSTISQSVANKHALYELLKPYQGHIISGHIHQNSNTIISPRLIEHNVSAVCGAWWQGPYAEDGTPKGYAVFEANGSELTWYFKSSGYDKDYQFRAYAVGANPEQPDFVTANVWNYDPEWKVYWYEDGQRMGEMELYSGKDPETTKAYSDKEKLAYKWVDARKNNHMFRAKPQVPSAKITVEVVDRFGNSYKQDLD